MNAHINNIAVMEFKVAFTKGNPETSNMPSMLLDRGPNIKKDIAIKITAERKIPEI